MFCVSDKDGEVLIIEIHYNQLFDFMVAFYIQCLRLIKNLVSLSFRQGQLLLQSLVVLSRSVPNGPTRHFRTSRAREAARGFHSSPPHLSPIYETVR